MQKLTLTLVAPDGTFAPDDMPVQEQERIALAAFNLWLTGLTVLPDDAVDTWAKVEAV